MGRGELCVQLQGNGNLVIRGYMMKEYTYIYCKTCGTWDRSWFTGFCDKRKQKQKRWKNLIKNNEIHFGYKIMPCIFNGHHVLQVTLTKMQLVRKLKKRCKENGVSFKPIKRALIRDFVH